MKTALTLLPVRVVISTLSGRPSIIRYSAFVKDIFDKLIKGFLGYCAYIIRYALTVGIACNGRLIFIKAAVIYCYCFRTVAAKNITSLAAIEFASVAEFYCFGIIADRVIFFDMCADKLFVNCRKLFHYAVVVLVLYAAAVCQYDCALCQNRLNF